MLLSFWLVVLFVGFAGGGKEAGRVGRVIIVLAYRFVCRFCGGGGKEAGRVGRKAGGEAKMARCSWVSSYDLETRFLQSQAMQ